MPQIQVIESHPMVFAYNSALGMTFEHHAFSDQVRLVEFLMISGRLHSGEFVAALPLVVDYEDVVFLEPDGSGGTVGTAFVVAGFGFVVGDATARIYVQFMSFLGLFISGKGDVSAEYNYSTRPST